MKRNGVEGHPLVSGGELERPSRCLLGRRDACWGERSDDDADQQHQKKQDPMVKGRRRISWQRCLKDGEDAGRRSACGRHTRDPSITPHILHQISSSPTRYIYFTVFIFSVSAHRSLMDLEECSLYQIQNPYILFGHPHRSGGVPSSFLKRAEVQTPEGGAKTRNVES